MYNYCVIYNGTFINLLSTIKYLLKNNIKPEKIVEEGKYTLNLFEYLYKPDVTDDPTLIKSINNISFQILKIIHYVFLSNNLDKELILYYFILNTLIYKEKVIYHRNLSCVNKALNISHHVSSEAHKLKGFTRFKMINHKFLYAEISPNNNVLEILSKHFAKRLTNELWIIKDTKRNILSIYDKKNYKIYSANEIKIFELENINNDTYYENLWKTFFQTISIKERKNTKRQIGFMPKKYWQNMIEMEDYNAKNN